MIAAETPSQDVEESRRPFEELLLKSAFGDQWDRITDGRLMVAMSGLDEHQLSIVQESDESGLAAATFITLNRIAELEAQLEGIGVEQYLAAVARVAEMEALVHELTDGLET